MGKRSNAVSLVPDESDDLVRSILKDLSKQLGDHLDCSIMGDGLFQAEPKEWFSSGLTLLDHAIGGAGTYPIGRFSEIFGDVATAKSMLIGYAMGIAQRQQNAICALVDTEHAWSTAFIRDRCGADPNRIAYLDPDDLEDCWDAIDIFIKKVREREQKRPILIAIDSLAGLSPREEGEASFAEYSSIATAARINKKAMRKLRKRITIDRAAILMSNQEIARVNAMAFGEKTTTSGGGGPKYFSSVRLKTSHLEKVAIGKGKDRELVGNRFQITVYKNRFNAPGRRIDYLVDFKHGIDDVESVVTYLKEKKKLGTRGRLEWAGETVTLKQLRERARQNPETWTQLQALARQTAERSVDEDDESVGTVEEIVGGADE